MATWLKHNAPSLKAEDIDAMAAGLSARARLHSQRGADQKDAGFITRGVGLIEKTAPAAATNLASMASLALAPFDGLWLVRMADGLCQRRGGTSGFTGTRTTACRRLPRTCSTRRATA